MTYLAEFGIYLNCHISGVYEAEIEADNLDEAKAIAEANADGMERRISEERNIPLEDVWVKVEGLVQPE